LDQEFHAKTQKHAKMNLAWDRLTIPRREEPMMKAAYDFSKGERGKFFRPGAELRLPIYLDADVQAYLAERAAQKGIPLNEMVNGLLKQEIQIVESVK
jgi:hypothetical protein